MVIAALQAKNKNCTKSISQFESLQIVTKCITKSYCNSKKGHVKFHGLLKRSWCVTSFRCKFCTDNNIRTLYCIMTKRIYQTPEGWRKIILYKRDRPPNKLNNFITRSKHYPTRLRHFSHIQYMSKYYLSVYHISDLLYFSLACGNFLSHHQFVIIKPKVILSFLTVLYRNNFANINTVTVLHYNIFHSLLFFSSL